MKLQNKKREKSMEQTVYSLTRLVKLTDRKSDKGKQRQRDKGEKKC